MFFFAAVASLMLVLPVSEAGGRQLVPAGPAFSGPDGFVVKIPGSLPIAPAADGSTDKVFGGFEAGEKAYPFVVRLVEAGSSFCGGVLVHPRYVLTSATCANEYTLVKAVLGDYDLIDDDGTEQEIAVADVILHPQYSGSINGTALVKLASRANTKSDAVAVAQLVDSAAFMEKVLNNERSCLQLGWGYVQVDGVWSLPRKMQAIGVNFVNDTEMYRRGYGYMPYRGMIGTEADYADECELGGACYGDEGSPVVCKKSGNWLVAGLYAYSDRTDGCMTGVKGTENVFSYYDWIQSYIA